jgi:uncharacterized protein (TIGR03118 family)
MKDCFFLFAVLVSSHVVLAQARTDVYLRHNLVSDLPAHAEAKDNNLVNPWGIASGPNGPFWISDNGTGVSTVYGSDGRPFPTGSPLVVTIPSPRGGTAHAAPTGIVFNSTGSFALPTGGKALFIFATEDGTISAWNQASGSSAILKVDNSASLAVYKGIAMATNHGSDFIYATNFHGDSIDVFDSTFAAAGSFTDTTVPTGYAPFGIQNIGGNLYVTFALQDDAKHDDVAGAGHGFVDVFRPDGTFTRLVSNGQLDSPWGLTVAPANFGAFSNSLLVGNFGDGTINAFDLSTGSFHGTLLTPSRRPIKIQGLWGLIFGNGTQAGDPGVLFFTAGIPGPGQIEDHGLFGEIRPQHQ